MRNLHGWGDINTRFPTPKSIAASGDLVKSMPATHLGIAVSFAGGTWRWFHHSGFMEIQWNLMLYFGNVMESEWDFWGMVEMSWTFWEFDGKVYGNWMELVEIQQWTSRKRQYVSGYQWFFINRQANLIQLRKCLSNHHGGIHWDMINHRLDLKYIVSVTVVNLKNLDAWLIKRQDHYTRGPQVWNPSWPVPMINEKQLQYIYIYNIVYIYIYVCVYIEGFGVWVQV